MMGRFLTTHSEGEKRTKRKELRSKPEVEVRNYAWKLKTKSQIAAAVRTYI